MEATNGRRDHLIERRRRLGFTQESLAHEVGVSPFTVAQWERGNVTPRPRYRPALAAALGIGVVEVERLLDPDGVVVLNGHSVSPWFSHYESLVHAAAQVFDIEVLAIPGLLQTKAYAEVIERAGEDRLCDDQVALRVDRRLTHQQILDRTDDPLELTAILPERLLRDRVGSPYVMKEQLTHLLEQAERPNIEILVLPPDGRDACAISGFELLSNARGELPFMACTFDVGGVRYHEDPNLVERFLKRFQHLRGVALSPDASSEVISNYREMNP